MYLQYSIYSNKKTQKKINTIDKTQKKAIDHKLFEIANDPYRFKPLKYPLNNKRRAHILKSFVLIYSIDEYNKRVILEYYGHHDQAYQTK